ncbi:MAG: hypothetical protein KAS22_07100, partial [Candidatus Heimdallarchaeota archaeon]|nr:hypothetical protein [Candidatus Heimdallarchaeota archaeon]
MKGLRRRILPSILIVLVFCTNIAGIQPQEAESPTYYFTLDGIVSGGGSRVDAFYLMREHLAQAGILLSIRNLYWADYIGEVIAFFNFDIVSHALNGGRPDPSAAELYSENSLWNLVGYRTSMDWDEDLGTGKNQWFIDEGMKFIPPNSEERIQHYWEWQDYLMDKICPILPTFSPVVFTAHWSNLLGYNVTDGILQSWGKMSWIGLHEGQESVEELVVTDSEWEDLNPLCLDDSASS